MFKLMYDGGSRGFHMTFGNGYTASVQFGAGNYGDNYNANRGRYEGGDVPNSSTQAEMAVWKPNGDFVQMDGGTDVYGYIDADEVLKIMNWAAAQPKDEAV